MPKKPRERRRRGDGSVTIATRDAQGRPTLWKGSISLGWITIDGKRRRHRPTVYAKTEAEAYAKLKHLQAQHLMGEDMTPGKVTVDAYYPHFLAHIKAVDSIRTYEIYERNGRNHILPAIGGLKLRALKTAHCQAMLDALPGKKLAPGTVQTIRAILICALNVAPLLGFLPQGTPNVATYTKIAQVPDPLPPSLTEDQLDRLLQVIAGDPIEPIIRVALGTGKRISEVLGLLWSGVLFTTQQLHITGAIKELPNPEPVKGKLRILVREPFTKAHDQHITRLSLPVADALDMQQQRQAQQRQNAGDAWQEQGLVFTDDYGGPLYPRKVSRRFKVLAEQAGLPPDFTFHGLRYACATFLMEGGAVERVLMEVLGHKNPRTSARYGRVPDEMTRAALDKHAERLNRRGGKHER